MIQQPPDYSARRRRAGWKYAIAGVVHVISHVAFAQVFNVFIQPVVRGVHRNNFAARIFYDRQIAVVFFAANTSRHDKVPENHKYFSVDTKSSTYKY